MIEKVRSAVTDSTGQYRIENLLPGTYTVTYSLTGFITVKRDSVDVSGAGVVSVNCRHARRRHSGNDHGDR